MDISEQQWVEGRVKPLLEAAPGLRSLQVDVELMNESLPGLRCTSQASLQFFYEVTGSEGGGKVGAWELGGENWWKV